MPQDEIVLSCNFRTTLLFCDGGSDLVQLVDALLHAADGGHGAQGVSVELPEAVLPADLEQRHHGSFLHGDTRSDQCGEARTRRK